MSGFDFDAAVIGAGAVGLACAYVLSKRGQSVVVLEAERRVGSGVSSRSSEVVHAGLYYPTGSLRARLCVSGRRMLYAFMESHGVPFERCGKLIVATDEGERAKIEALAAQGEINEVGGLEWLTGDEARAMEPALHAVAALWSAETGIFDTHAYMSALVGEIEDAGGTLAVATPFAGAEPLPGGGYRVRTGGDDPTTLSVLNLVAATGLHVQETAAAIEGYPHALIPRRHLAKGSYFTLAGRAPFKALVYPVPVPGALGVHYTRDLGGQARFGPDIEFVDEPDYRVDPRRADSFYGAVRRYWPGLPDGALVPAYAGIRPKIHGPGEPQPDFRIDGPDVHGLGGVVALFGIESPGLTSSLAIGEAVAERLDEP